MKKIMFLLIICLFAIAGYSENFSFNGKYSPDLYSTLDYFEINKDTVSLIYQDNAEVKVIPYKKVYKNGLLFFELEENFPKNFCQKNNIETSNDLLILSGKSINQNKIKSGLQEKDGEIFLFATTLGFDKNYPFIYPMFRFAETCGRQYSNCSSYLKEKNKEYVVENLCDFNVDTPWVEAAAGDGIGEGFTLVNSWGEKYTHILLMNGYISYEKPYLYKQNNRIKKIKVTGLKSKKSKVLDVLDTPHPQTVDISFITDAEDIRVEIADVYKGSKYDDTCLSFCITYKNEVIPYENSIPE